MRKEIETVQGNKRIWIVLAVLALFIGACGSGDTATEEVSVTTTAAAAVTTTVMTPTVSIDEVAQTFLSTMPEGFLAVGDIAAFKEAVDTGGAYVIDVRTAGEYAEGHIPGAINIPLNELSAHLDMVPTDRQVFVHCKTGHRAGLATSALHMLGYDNVVAFPPGFDGWSEAGEEVATDTVTAETFTVPEIDQGVFDVVDQFLTLMPEGYLSIGDVTAMQEAMDAGAFVLDVRTGPEYAEGHIPGAYNIPLTELAARVEEIPTDQNVVVYCKSGHRAALADGVLNMLGLNNVRAFPSSYNGWTAAELAVET